MAPTAERDREELAAFLMRMRSEEAMEPRLMAAFESVPRRLFLPQTAADIYADQSFPLSCGQTMASARAVVRLLAAMKIRPESRILEVGTGSGYVTALLARLGANVTSLDRYRRLLQGAGERLKSLSIANVSLELEDGWNGCAAAAPFDRVVVHGAFEMLPRPFLEQMASGGILICGIGPTSGAQALTRHQKSGSRFEVDVVGQVFLQPLQRGVAAFL